MERGEEKRGERERGKEKRLERGPISDTGEKANPLQDGLSAVCVWFGVLCCCVNC